MHNLFTLNFSIENDYTNKYINGLDSLQLEESNINAIRHLRPFDSNHMI